MRKTIFELDPLRTPCWRHERVISVLRQSRAAQQISRRDDYYIRAYHRFLRRLIAADNDEKRRDEVCLTYPIVTRAHAIYYSADAEQRNQVEAWLLTGEPFDKIAVRFATEPAVIEHFEKLFFSVRQQLTCTPWISKVIRAPLDGIRVIKCFETASAKRAYVYRLFAYVGGPLALEAMIGGLSPIGARQDAKDIAGWFDDQLRERVRTCAAVAACEDMPIRDSTRLMKIALRLRSKGRSQRAVAERELEGIVERIFPTGCSNPR